jgi:hypothetical protein
MTDSSIALEHLTAAKIPHLRLDAAGQLVYLAEQSITTTPLRKLPLQAIAHLKAAVYWLHDYQPDATVPHIDQVRGYLEAFYHLGELSAWKLAYSLLYHPISSTLPNPLSAFPLHQQLEIWGYYQELTDLLRSLLGKLDNEIECFCLTRLGRILGLRGLFDQGITYAQQAIALATQQNDLIAKTQAHLELVDLYGRSEQYWAGTQHSEIALTLAKQLQHLPLQAQAFTKLTALTAAHQPNRYQYQKIVTYAQAGLALANELGDRSLECELLGHLGEVWSQLGKSSKAIQYFEQQLVLAKEIGHLRKQWSALTNCSTIYFLKKQFTQARQLTEQAISIAQQMQDIYCETFTLSNLVAIGIGVEELSDFKPYFLEALTRAQQDGKVYQEWLLWQCLAAISLKVDLATAKDAINAADLLMSQIKPSSSKLHRSDLLNFSYLLCRLGQWQTGLHYARRGLVICRRNQYSYNEFCYRLITVYAYWQGQQRFKSVYLFLCYLPKSLWLASQSSYFRYTFSIGLNVLTQPSLKIWHSLLSYFRLSPGKQ